MPFHFFKAQYHKLSGYFLRQSLVKKIALIFAAFMGAGIISFALLIFLVWIGVFGTLPGKEELDSISNPVATEVYSSDSVLLGRYFIQERSTVDYDHIATPVIHALIATEDVRFYNHNGIDYKSFLRVGVRSILFQDESSGGGSTITQQLVKNLYPRRNYSFLSLPVNKIREGLIAKKMERIYSKQEILTLYLNTIPFGDNTYGIQAAAERFFSVSASELTTVQAAVLIGMLKATYSYNPRVFPERSRMRRDVVLSQMSKYGFLRPEAKDSLQALPLELVYNRINHHSGIAPYFRAYLNKELEQWSETHVKPNGKHYNLYTDGLKIYTTIDSRLQRYAEEAVRKQMAALQEEFDRHWRKSEPWHNNPQILKTAIYNSAKYQSLKQQGLSEEAIMERMKEPVLMNIFTWNGEKERTMTSLDSIKHYLRFLNAGMVAMDPQTGEVKVWVGGIDHYFFQYDHVRSTTRRQVGSTFKPIVYAAALEKGIKPCHYISAEKTVYTNMEEGDWKPENTEENYGLKYSMEGALTYSVNTVSVKLLEQTGINNAVALARHMGITSDIPAVPSIALGTPSISVTEMVTAYSSFANGGRAVRPYYLTAITTHNDSLIERFQPERHHEQVMKKENAQLIVQMLKRVVDEGTGSGLRTRYGIDSDIAGKTGTTQSNADGWFMALTPNLVVGTWVGCDNPGIRFRTTALGQGAHTALPVFATFYRSIMATPDFNYVTRAHFEALPQSSQRALGCDLFKEDKTFLEKIFGKKEEGVKEKEFGMKEEKEGFFKKLFGRK